MVNPSSLNELAIQLEMAGTAISKSPNAKVRACAQHLLSAAAACKSVSDYVLDTDQSHSASIDAIAKAVNAMRLEASTELQSIRDQILVMKSDVAALNSRMSEIPSYDNPYITYDKTDTPYTQ